MIVDLSNAPLGAVCIRPDGSYWKLVEGGWVPSTASGDTDKRAIIEERVQTQMDFAECRKNLGL